jgi:hypothetical protein
MKDQELKQYLFMDGDTPLNKALKLQMVNSAINHQ